MTETASATKIPPVTTRISSCFVTTASAPSAPPKAREPVSPMKTSAGWALYQRKPRLAPRIAPQKTTSSPLPGMYWMRR